jgi:hypothetical protein
MFKSAHKCPICRSHSRHCIRLTSAMYLEPVINCPAGGVLPRHVRAGDPIARENRAGPGSPRISFVGWRRGGGVGCRGSTVESDNKVWRDFRRNPGVPDIFVAGWKRRAGADFPHFGVVRRSKISDIRRSSLLELRKIGSQRRLNNRRASVRRTFCCLAAPLCSRSDFDEGPA